LRVPKGTTSMKKMKVTDAQRLRGGREAGETACRCSMRKFRGGNGRSDRRRAAMGCCSAEGRVDRMRRDGSTARRPLSLNGGRNSIRRERRRDKVTASAFHLLDNVVRQLNRVIGTPGSMFGEFDAPLNIEDDYDQHDADPSREDMLDTTGYKRIVISISLKDDAKADDSGASSAEDDGSTARSLERYLSLPVEDYSVLNPKWITRVDSQGKDQFLLKVPLYEIIGVELEPSILAEVSCERLPNPFRSRLDQARRLTLGSRRSIGEESSRGVQVTVTGKESKMGNVLFDNIVDATFCLRLTHERPPDRKRRKHAAVAVDIVKGEQEKLEDASAKKVVGNLTLDLEIKVPSPISKLPSRVLEFAGGAATKLVMKRMLSGFLNLLMEDFQR